MPKTLVLIAALLIGCSSGSYTIKFQPKLGDKFTYVINSDNSGQKSSTEVTMECTKVEGDKVTIATTINGTKVIKVQDSTGRVLESRLDGAPAGGPPPASNSVAFPTQPIKVGDSWSGTIKMGMAEVKATNKLVKVEGNEGTFEITLEKAPEGVTMVGPVVSVIDLSNGMSISNRSHMRVKRGLQVVEIITEMKRK